ncbi:anthranilate synthase component I family protein [Ferrimicrobium acidiphilum]|uniref:anthranilate synthase component I family protein n=1 Tax=Ferrimicrobium acidiphilum TaxID=121039 RepID=UPI0023F3CAA3|nr:chorismate-binding protein [Ferrimicrobium acidiphilum]
MSFDEFQRSAEKHSLVALTQTLLVDTITPVAAFDALVGADGDGFIFESVDQVGRWSRFSFVGRSPLGRVVVRHGSIETLGHLPVQPVNGEGIFDYLERLTAALSMEPLDPIPFAGGLLGYLGYDVVREIEPTVGETVVDDLELPDVLLNLVGELAVFDHWSQTVTLVVNVLLDPGRDRRDQYDEAIADLKQLADDFCQIRSDLGPNLISTPQGAERTLLDDASTVSYEAIVERAKEYILAGDIFQVVLSRRFDFPLLADSLSLYRALRITNPSPYMYLLQAREVTVVGSSPEALVTADRNGSVMVRPIAGTRPRGASDDEDARYIEELKEDPKERAEHIMLVDLARNDVGKVAEFGSVEVANLMIPELFAKVIHLTSEVVGRLSVGVSHVSLLKATLPAGTLSGAPKVRAMQIIDELESTRRGVYGGVVGYFSAHGSLDFAIAIRTVVVDPAGVCHLQVGAGIVVDSIGSNEAAETVSKAAAVARAVMVARGLTGRVRLG